MLKIPELKPGDTPFAADNPDLFAADFTDHALVFGKPTQENPAAKPAELSPENLLQHLLVKDTLTSLHREDDAQTAKLRTYTGLQIQDLIPEQKRFLQAQKDKYNTLFKEEGQRRLFQEMSRSYFSQALTRAENLQRQKIRDYQHEVIDRQNQELLERALRPENAFNDLLQTDYRDLILHNLETTLADLPEAERKERLDTLSRDIYRRIMDKRLELDPKQVVNILKAPAVRRVLGEVESGAYEQKALEAARRHELRLLAQRWLAEDLTPTAAKARAKQELGDDEAKQVFTEYAALRYQKNRKLYLGRIVDLTRVWRLILETDLQPHAIPYWVQHGNPELYACLLNLLAKREQNGGAIPDPDYTCFLSFCDSFSPEKTAEKLRSAKEIYDLAEALGGPDSDSFAVMVRILIGKAKAVDWLWLRDLRLARDRYQASFPAEADMKGREEGLKRFLAGFDQVRRLWLIKNKVKEMDLVEVGGVLDGYCETFLGEVVK